MTLNVNLGRDFFGGELVFYGPKEERHAHPTTYHTWEDGGVGHGVLHLGKQVRHPAATTRTRARRRWRPPPPRAGRTPQVHAALPISSGERLNLVMWLRSSEQRKITGCPMCDRTDRLLTLK